MNISTSNHEEPRIILQKNEDSRVELQIVIPSAAIDKQVQQQAAHIAKTRPMPGYRKNKVPVSVILRKMSEALIAQATDDQLRSALKQALEPYRVYGSPVISAIDSEGHNAATHGEKKSQAQDLGFLVAFDLLPDIKSPDLTMLTIDKPVLQFNAEDIEEQLSKERYALADVADKETNQVAEAEDIVGVELLELQMNDQQMLLEPAIQLHYHLAKEHFLFQDKQQFIGKKVGDQLKVKISIPENIALYDPKFKPLHMYAGQEGYANIKINSLQALVLPALESEKLLKKLGCDAADGINQAIDNILHKQTEQEVYTLLKIRLFNQLERLLDYKLPAGLVEREKANLRGHLNNQGEQPSEETENLVTRLADRRARIALFIAHYADEQKIQVTDQDIRAYIISEANKMPWMAREIVQFYSSNKGAVANQVLEDKVVQFILTSVTLNQVPTTTTELEQLVSKESEIDIAASSQPL